MPAKGVQKKGMKKKGGKKKVIDPFLKKEWCVIKVPRFLPTKQAKWRVGYSPVNKKSLDKRSFIINLADLHDDNFTKPYENKRNIKFKFVTEEVFGPQLLTQFNGMEITRDYRCSLIRKERTMIQGIVDVKTSDGYVLRIKALAFTKRLLEQVKKHAYAKRSQVRQIRAKMVEIIRNNSINSNLESVINKLINGRMGKDIRKSCQLIYPLQKCLIEKVKVLKKPKKDVARTMAMHDLTSGFDEIKQVINEDENSDSNSNSEENEEEMNDRS